jgi:hypothetical protein
MQLSSAFVATAVVYFPGPQSVHVVCFTSAFQVPYAQSLQLLWPALAWNSPATQLLHVLGASFAFVPYSPGWHTVPTHSVMPTSEAYCPAKHTAHSVVLSAG